MSIIDTLITNRTYGAKYDYEDLNRVGVAVLYLENIFRQCGYIPIISSKTDWKNGDNQTISQMEKYLKNIIELKSQIPIIDDGQTLPTKMDYLTSEGANAIEQILININNQIKKMQLGYYYLQDIYLGEV